MAAPGVKSERKGHVCPPSNATHPSDRWESLFVYSFIVKFTNIKERTQGFETPMDLENALMLREPNDILTKILARFILNLKPQTRNLSADQISTTVISILSEYLKTNERTVFWDDTLKANVDPFEGTDCGFFTADWDLKLKILRQFVELQLTHSQEIKATIDRAWGVVHNKHKKEKRESSHPLVERAQLEFAPLGQDCKRERFWIVDDSPRIYVSTNPWKISASFKAISSTREEYLAVIEQLKANTPQPQKKGKKTKPEQQHKELIEHLEGRIESIDIELARVARVRKKIEQNRMLMAQAELRQTRTRRQTQKPDYVYYDNDEEEDDVDGYEFQDERDDEEFEEEDSNQESRRPRRGGAVGTRRSTRAAVANGNGKREGSSESSGGTWRGERRSARLGFTDPFDGERPAKRARTEESTASEGSVVPGVHNGVTVLEEIAGKKRSKFWVYAVEPVPDN